MKYGLLEPGDDGSFAGMTLRPPALPGDGIPVPCPMCRGYGGWRASQRTEAFCTQCEGWGYVAGGSPDAACVHQWKEVKVGNCLHRWTCQNCGTTRLIDSSG